MNSAITNGIKVSVEPAYQPGYSRPELKKFIFSYKIIIENQGSETVQLLRRHWYIYDSGGLNQEVEGEGVIGEQPILEPGERHSYSSWCALTTGFGKMKGTYLMENQNGKKQFEVVIPEFQLILPGFLN